MTAVADSPTEEVRRSKDEGQRLEWAGTVTTLHGYMYVSPLVVSHEGNLITN